MFRIILILVVALAALVIAALLVIAFLPNRRTVTQVVRLNASPQEVLARLNDLADQPRWRPELAAVEVGPLTKDGQVWTEVLRVGPRIRFHRPGVWQGTQLTCSVDGSPHFGGTWSASLAVDGAGTQLTLMEDMTYTSFQGKVLGYTVARLETLMAQYARDLKASF